MIRKLSWLLAFLAAWFLLHRFVRRVSTSSATAGRSASRFEGLMVRDRICQTFLPRAKALCLWIGDQEHFFCSEACRESFLSGRRVAR